VIATYASGDLVGLPAVTRHSFLAGTAWYLSTLLPDNALTTLLGSIIGEAGGVPPGSPGVSVTRRRVTDGQSWLFAFNYGDGPASVRVSGVDLVSGAAVSDVLRLAPGGYAVVREEPSPDG
jgi:beta-galactosidase